MVRFGVTLPNAGNARLQDMRLLPEYAARAEELGFHSIWVTDRLLHRLPSIEPLTSLAYVASYTKSVTLGTSVLISSLRNPVIVAKTLASLDYLSNGRAALGIGVGSWPDEFDASSVSLRERGRRMEEAIQVMKNLWMEDNVNYEGRFWKLRNASMNPKPIKKPHPPIYIGGKSEAVLSRVGRLGDGWIASTTTRPQDFKAGWNKILEYAKRAGRKPEELEPAKLIYVAVEEDRAKAKDVLNNYFKAYYGAERDVEATCLLGTPEDCSRQSAAYFEAGVKTLIFNPITPELLILEPLSRIVKATE